VCMFWYRGWGASSFTKVCKSFSWRNFFISIYIEAYSIPKKANIKKDFHGSDFWIVRSFVVLFLLSPPHFPLPFAITLSFSFSCTAATRCSVCVLFVHLSCRHLLVLMLVSFLSFYFINVINHRKKVMYKNQKTKVLFERIWYLFFI